jgi:hypothetical protein
MQVRSTLEAICAHHSTFTCLPRFCVSSSHFLRLLCYLNVQSKVGPGSKEQAPRIASRTGDRLRLGQIKARLCLEQDEVNELGWGLKHWYKSSQTPRRLYMQVAYGLAASLEFPITNPDHQYQWWQAVEKAV